MNEIEKLINEYRGKVADCNKKLEEPKRLNDKELAVVHAQSQAYLQMQKDLESLLIIIEDAQKSITDHFTRCIGNKNYNDAYGFNGMDIQKKYLLLEKSK